MQDRQLGPTSAFAGAMASPVARKAKEIKVVATAAFSVLEFMFDGGNAQQVNPATLSYDSFTTLENVKRFQLASGSIIVVFYGAPPPAP